MRWFNNLKVAAKLISSFIIVAIIAGVVGIVGITNIVKMDELDTDMYERHTATLDKEFKQLSQYIKEHYGINLKDEKKTLVTGRLQNVLTQNGYDDFTEYYNYIISDNTGNAVATLVNKITTNHTFFMREADHFIYFKDIILPYLVKTVMDKDLRIWSAGCSSGEEPYTLAMLIDETLGKEKIWWDSKVLATDISSRVLEEAKNGLYKHEELNNLPHSWKLNYFRKQDNDNALIIDRIKNEVIFLEGLT